MAPRERGAIVRGRGAFSAGPSGDERPAEHSPCVNSEFFRDTLAGAGLNEPLVPNLTELLAAIAGGMSQAIQYVFACDREGVVAITAGLSEQRSYCVELVLIDVHGDLADEASEGAAC